ncbi:MAG: ABC-ATPase domain-containing protein [Methanomicrobiaceae archaeon]|nr:ABC-ATPase domain-containing protein [Methanomicrobiaceae archaeon]
MQTTTIRMKSDDDLRNQLRRIDGRGYKAYRDIKGVFAFLSFTLNIDHIQGDPFAAPSKMRVQLPLDVAGLPPETHATGSRETALCDFLTRRFAKEAENRGARRRGSGKSGLIAIDRPGQEILERTSVLLGEGTLEARFVAGLPARGRTIAGRQAEAMLLEDIPAIIEASLLYENLDHDALVRHIEVNEDAEYLRACICRSGLIAFVADGSVLPRASGVDDRPMTGPRVVPFTSPPSLVHEVELPNCGTILGMGISEGITLITGGGYHGKSTLLNALERGIYNHIPGDGREFVVSNPSSVKIRAEDGRRIEKVDISPFISNLPFGQETRAFSTDDASGSTSQAANIMEALEIGAKALFIDEDTSATNFMIRDHRMQELIAKEKEPITPFIDKVAQISHDHGVSTVLVIGGSGDYFDVAGCVICMDEYTARDCTRDAHAIAERYRAERVAEGGDRFGAFRERIPLPGSFDPSRGRREVKISPKGMHAIAFGNHTIDLSAVEQLVDISQTNAIGDAIHCAVSLMDGQKSLSEVVHSVEARIREHGLDAIGPQPAGDYAEFRPFELAAAINRLRTMCMKQKKI